MTDSRKYPSKSSQFIPDGFFHIGEREGIKEYLYLGENAEIITTREPHLAGSVAEIIELANSLVVEFNSGTFLSGISGGSDNVFASGKGQLFSYTKEYMTIPSTKSPPSGKIVNKRTQVTQNGVTINGDVIITGGSKGFIITETYLGTNSDINQGTTEGNSIITSVSKSNPRYINGSLYYNYSVTYQEI
jgi:hypothetical protein